jgi:hypothetical protein
MDEFKEGRPAQDLPRSVICAESYLPTRFKNFVLEVLFFAASTDWVDFLDILREAEAQQQLRASKEQILATVSILHLYTEKM